MTWSSLRAYTAHLEAMGELKRITVPVDTKLEITEITDRVVKSHGTALLFENNGTSFPLLINAFGSDTRMAAALGVFDLDEIPAGLGLLLERLMSMKDAGLAAKIGMLPRLFRMTRWLPRKVRGRGLCQEVVMPEPDLGQLPVLTCWPHDGGAFITLPLVHTVDPQTGESNTGMYRMQVYDGQTAGMHWHLHKDGAAHYRKYKAMGLRMPVTVTLGGDPVYSYAATAPLPPFVDEFLFSGVIRKRGVKLVKSLTNGIWIPADADIVIEGYVDPQEPLRMEGPFGDHTGFYSLADLYPVFHVTAITHRKDAVYPATVVGIPPQEDLWLGKATEKIFLMPLRKTVAPEITDMHMPAEGVFHNIVEVSLRKDYPGQPQKVAGALWGAGQMMFNKIMVLCKEDTSLQDYPELLRMLSASVDPDRDLFFSSGPMDVLDHSGRSFAFGSKMGIDATNNRELPQPRPLPVEVKSAISDLHGVTGVLDELIREGVAMIAVFADKAHAGPIRELHRKVAPLAAPCHVRCIFYLDPEALGMKPSDLLWLASGNMDPERDVFLERCQESTFMGVDATRKNLQDDGFRRDWPNLVCMDPATIALVDGKWGQYGLGPFMESPSKRFLPYQKGEGAAVRG